MTWRWLLWAPIIGACSEPPANKTTPTAPVVKKAPTSCQESVMRGEQLTIRETAQAEISNHLVGAANIYERELPDAAGTVARRMSALLVISAPGSDAVRRETVHAGSIVSIGTDRYCVTAVEPGTTAPGSLTLEKL